MLQVSKAMFCMQVAGTNTPFYEQSGAKQKAMVQLYQAQFSPVLQLSKAMLCMQVALTCVLLNGHRSLKCYKFLQQLL